MSSPVIKIAEGMKMKNQNKTRVGVGSIVKSKVGELEKITRKGRSRRTSKEVVVCVQDVAEKEKFISQLKYG